MEAVIFILIALVFGLVTFLAHLSGWISVPCILTLFGGYFAWALRQHDRAVKPLRADFNRLFQQYASMFGQTRSGKKFLRVVSKPIRTKSDFDEAFNNVMEIGQAGYAVFTDPASFVLGLVLAPVLSGVGSLIGKVWKDDKTEEQKLMEAVLLRARYAMDQQSNPYYYGIFASSVVMIGNIVICAMVHPLKLSPLAVASKPAVSFSPVDADTPAPTTPTPTPVPLAAATPEPPLVTHEETVAAQMPLRQTFETVADAERAAVERYPALGIEGSKFNTAFVYRYKIYQEARPEYFQDTSWPMNLAAEIAQGVR